MEPELQPNKKRSNNFPKIAIVSAFLLLGLIYFRGDIDHWYWKFFGSLRVVNETAAEIGQVTKAIHAPEPLRSDQTSRYSFLTVSGVLKWTNQNRVENGVDRVALNSKLNAAATKKVEDMFAKQYFEHQSPDGKNASDLATQAGYEYVTIGENLALGNWENDEALVTAWMNSPGHRANILNAGYTEIGIAVRKGTFEGRSTWLAVQIFAKPLDACPQPNSGTKDRIDENKQAIDSLKVHIDDLKAGIDAMQPKRGEEYNKKIDEFNSLVMEYNSLVEVTRALIESYNNQVAAFNECAKS